MKSDKLIENYLPLVKSIVRKYLHFGLPREDLEQEGLIGLMEAAARFDESRQASFSTYATYWIKKRIIAALENEKKSSMSSLSLDEEQLEMPDHASKPPASHQLDLPTSLPEDEKQVLTALFQEELTLSEIAAKLNLPRERVRQLKEKALRRLRAGSDNTSR